MSYSLMDGPERQHEAPYTFFLPHPALVDALEPGDHAKVGFEYDAPVEQYGAERMWVLIAERDGDRFKGTIANEPYEDVVALGDEVEFARNQILDVDYAEGKAELEVPSVRTYWARCLVDECVLKDAAAVEYIYREQPNMAQEDDEHPDSGWRIRGRQGAASDAEMEARELNYVALGAVLNRDDSWLDLIDAPVGSAFMRNFGTNRYDPVA